MDSNIKTKARLLDDDPSLLVNNRINMSKENRTLAGKLLTKIYTNSSFEKDIGAYIRVSLESKSFLKATRCEISGTIAVLFMDRPYYENARYFRLTKKK